MLTSGASCCHPLACGDRSGGDHDWLSLTEVGLRLKFPDQ